MPQNIMSRFAGPFQICFLRACWADRLVCSSNHLAVFSTFYHRVVKSRVFWGQPWQPRCNNIVFIDNILKTHCHQHQSNMHCWCLWWYAVCLHVLSISWYVRVPLDPCCHCPFTSVSIAQIQAACLYKPKEYIRDEPTTSPDLSRVWLHHSIVLFHLWGHVL